MPTPESGVARPLQQPPTAVEQRKKGRPIRFVHYEDVSKDDRPEHKILAKRKAKNARVTSKEDERPTHTFILQNGVNAAHEQKVAQSHTHEHGDQSRLGEAADGASGMSSQAVADQDHSQDSEALVRELKAKHPLPWAYTYPNTVDFYNHNAPDYSGIRLYDERSIHPEGHKRLLRESPLDFTMQVMLSERARHDGADRRLDHIKVWTMRSINGILQRAVGDKALLALTPVGALAFYDAIHEDHCGSADLHLKGVQALLHRFGDIDKHNFHTACLIRYADTLHSYYQQKPRVIARRNSRTDIVDGMHALRLGLQPVASGLSEHRLKIHMAMSFGSPAEYLFFTLWRLDERATMLLDRASAPPSMTPAEARADIERMLVNARTFASWRNELSTHLYSEEDQANHRDTFTLIHLSALVLLFKMLRVIVGPTAKAEADLDHHVQKALMHLLWPKLGVRSPQALLWALFVSTPFLAKGAVLRQVVAGHIAKLCRRLGLAEWQDVRSFLTGIHFCAPLQEEACLDLWLEIQVMFSGPDASFQLANKSQPPSGAEILVVASTIPTGVPP